MKSLRTLSMLVILASILVTGCKKEEYQPKGDYQPAGNYVTSGTNNNTVKNYDITVNTWEWTFDNTYQRHYYRYGVAAHYNSLVVCYVISGSGKQIMPYYEGVSQQGYDFANNLFQTWQYIELQYTNYNSPSSAPSSARYFYIVVVPPSAREAHPNLDYSDLNQVKSTFNLKD
ncbi:MAG: hypothetical protein KDD41_11125 [Flavobacteriales bacterium]|nr:hypothetical protein [Flavobacteriales bacterium]